MTKIDLDLAWQQVRRLPTTAQEAGVLFRVGLAPVTRPAGHDHRAAEHEALGHGRRRDPHRRPPRPRRARPGRRDRRAHLPPVGRTVQRAGPRLAASDGLDDKSVIAVLCRDHRGLIETMFAAGKLGAKLLLMNTGFAKPQFAEVVEREGANILVYDVEFSEILGNVPEDVPRYLAWTDGDDNEHETLESLIESSHHRGPASAEVRRRAGAAHQRHDRNAEGRVAPGQLTVRRRAVPRSRAARPERADVLRRAAVPRHRPLAVPASPSRSARRRSPGASSTRARRSRRSRNTSARRSCWCRRCCNGCCNSATTRSRSSTRAR